MPVLWNNIILFSLNARADIQKQHLFNQVGWLKQ
jgi:hypothetical protein